MPLSNSELAQQLIDQTATWQTFNLNQFNWLTSTNATEDLYDPATDQTITVKTPYQWEQDYDAVLGGASSSLAVATQLLTDAQALQANVVAINDAVIGYDATFVAYLNTAEGHVDACADHAANAALSALAAQTSANAAATSETNAGNSATAAAASETAAGLSEANASTSETNAAASEAAADADRIAAETARTQAQTAKADAESEAANALTSRNEAQSFRNQAEDWAQEAEDVEVAPGQYSALHHAAKAAASEAGVAADATAAQTAATNAAASEASVAADAAAATTAAANAATSETNAAQSETDANSHKNLAQQWAEEDEDVEVAPGQYSAKHHRLKAVDASNAALSAQTAAENEAVDSLTYSQAAFAAKNLAETAQANAETAETNAANSASAAATSETNAATSASNAATSETNAGNSEIAAETAKNQAQTAANTAIAFEGIAERWASEDEDVTVQAGEYSAKHYSIKAAAEKTAAETAKTAAETAQTAAEAAQTAAEAAADRKYLSSRNAAAGNATNITTPTVANISNNITYSGSGYGINGTTNVFTLSDAGDHEINCKVLLDQNTVTRANARVHLEISTNAGGSWTELDNAFDYAYLRQTATPAGAHISGVWNFAAGTWLRIVIDLDSGAATDMSQVANGTIISLKYLGA